MSNRSLSTARGIAHGIDSAVKNLQAITSAKKKLEYDQERDKLTDSVKKAQIKKYEFDLGEAESKANRTQQMFERISAKREGFEAGVKTPGPGTIPVGDMLPTGSRFTSDDITMSGPPHRTQRQQGGRKKAQDWAYDKFVEGDRSPEVMRLLGAGAGGDALRDKKADIQKRNALDFINSVVNMASETGELSDGKKTIKYSPEIVKVNLLKKFKGLDINDPDIVAAIPGTIDPATKMEKFMKKQKYPQKKHPRTGYTYERREDGKWHLLPGV